jgi:hypothetical protein
MAAAVTAAISLSPSCGPAGASVQVSGTGWVSGSNAFDITITFDSTAVATVKAADIKADGSFTTNITVPNRPQRGTPYAVVASQTVGEFSQATATANFSLPCASITVVPTCGSVGAPIAVHGAGFRADIVVQISFVPPAGAKPVASAIPGGDSTFDVRFAVPSDPPGNYAVVATQTYAAAALAVPPLVVRATFTIPCATRALIKLVPQIGPPGTVVTVTGTGFPIGAIVKLSWNRGVPFRLASMTIDASQGFQVKLLIFPHDELGKRTLSAGPDLSVANATIFNIATADFLVVPGSEQPRDFSWRR